MRNLVGMKWAAAVLLVGLGTLGARAQGPIDGYLKGRGEADLAVGYSRTGAKTFIGGDGTAYADFPFDGQILSGFLAVGVSERVDVVASVPFVFTDGSQGLQDGALFVKGLVLRTPIGTNGQQTLDVLAALGASVPLSKYEVLSTGAIGQRAKLVQPRLVLQYNRPGFFASTVLGYNYRFDGLDEARLAEIQVARPTYTPEDPQDFVNVLLRVGVPAERFYADAWLELQRTMGGSNFVPDVEELPQSYDVDYQQVGGTLYYSEGPILGFALSGAAFLSGRNTSKLWRVSGTIVVKFRPEARE